MKAVAKGIVHFGALCLVMLVGVSADASRQPSQAYNQSPGMRPRAPMGNTNAHRSGPVLNLPVHASSTNMLRNLEMEAKNSPRPNINGAEKFTWPAPPRAWMQNDMSRFVQTDTSIGYQAFPSFFGLPANVAAQLFKKYKYFRKSSFVMIVPDNGHEPVQNFSTSRRSSLKRNLGYDVMGLCMFELNFDVEQSLGTQFLVAGNGNATKAGENRGLSYVYLSSFFKVDPDYTTTEYELACRDLFARTTETKVEAQFTSRIYEILFWENPASECSPVEEHLKHKDGDHSCFEFAHTKLTTQERKLTVPRCELQDDGAHRCVAKWKTEGAICPWKNNELAPFGDRDFSLITGCDSHQGLECLPDRKSKRPERGICSSVR